MSSFLLWDTFKIILRIGKWREILFCNVIYCVLLYYCFPYKVLSPTLICHTQLYWEGEENTSSYFIDKILPQLTKSGSKLCQLLKQPFSPCVMGYGMTLINNGVSKNIMKGLSLLEMLKLMSLSITRIFFTFQNSS